MNSFAQLLCAFTVLLSSQSFCADKSDVIVHLFEWTWRDVALECENFLGPRGFSAVQVSPPQEHGIWPGRPWFERYQPVSYNLISKSGNEAQFREMVQRCQRVGVNIIVDLVINHMAPLPEGAESSVGSGGTVFYPFKFPGWYQPWDFHYCRGPGKDNSIHDFEDRWDVQNCELALLPDLKTESAYVQDRIAGYLSYLLSLGVSGFRLDAAKHIPAQDLRKIYRKMIAKRKLRVLPDSYSEIYDYGKSTVPASEYFDFGQTTEFRFPLRLAEVFYQGKLSYLKDFGPKWGFYPSEKVVVFIDNHDTQRYEAPKKRALSYKTPQLYKLANIFMLAWPYGRPALMSSFAFDLENQSPPSLKPGVTKPVYDSTGKPHCGTDWICEHRWQEIVRMVQFRAATRAQEKVTDWWSDGGDRIAFGRGSLGFVILNKTSSSFAHTFQTSMPEGTYCNVLTTAQALDQCLRSRSLRAVVRIDSLGKLQTQVPAFQAVAVHVGSRVEK